MTSCHPLWNGVSLHRAVLAVLRVWSYRFSYRVWHEGWLSWRHRRFQLLVQTPAPFRAMAHRLLHPPQEVGGKQRPGQERKKAYVARTSTRVEPWVMSVWRKDRPSMRPVGCIYVVVRIIHGNLTAEGTIQEMINNHVSYKMHSHARVYPWAN